MKGRLVRLAMMVAIIATLLGAGSAMAGPYGEYLGMFRAPDGTWQRLEVGARHWYSFEYDGEEGQITVRMDVEPDHLANFRILTPACFDLWRTQGELTCIGCGESDEDECLWSGHFNTAGTYYVIVDHRDTKDVPAYYSLEVEGKGVWFTPEVDAALTTVKAVAKAEPAVKPLAKQGSGAGPADALAPDAEWLSLDVGQSIWFAVRYDGSETGIRVTLDGSPVENVAFKVWTPAQIVLMGRGDEVDPIGRGSPDEVLLDRLSWCGCFVDGGLYYVEVVQVGAVPANFKLSVCGEKVWF